MQPRSVRGDSGLRFFSCPASVKGAESSPVSSKPGARRYSHLREQGNDPGTLTTSPSTPAFPKGTALGSPIPSVDGVSITAGASYMVMVW